MGKLKIYNRFDWWLNSNTTDAIADNDLVVAKNVYYNASWQLQTRRGYRTFWSQIGSNPITSYFFFQRDDTQAKVAVCVSGSQMYYLDTSEIRQTISWAGNLVQYETIPWQTSKRTRWDFVVYKNKAYMCDGVNPYCSFDWTTRAQIGVSSVWTGLTFDNTTEKRNYVWHSLSNWDEVYFTTSGTSPTGLTPYQIYYVINQAANDFQVSTTPNGSAVAFTTNGSWTLTLYKLTEPRIRYLLINSWVCWSAGEDKNPLTAYYSNALTWLSDLTNINSNLAIIWPWEPWVINGLSEYAQGVLILKSSRVHYASLATGSFASSAIDSSTWWYSDRAIATVANSLVYYSERGVDSVAKRAWVDGAGALESQPLSYKIKELLDQIEPNNYNSGIGRYIEASQLYIFWFDSNGDDVPDTFVTYSSRTWGRTQRELPEAYDFGEYIDSDGNPQYLFASANGGQMYQYDYWFDDNGVAIQAEVRTKNYDLWEWIFEYVELEWYKEEWWDINVTVYVDEENSAAWVISDSNLNLSNTISIGVTPIGIATLWWWDAPAWLTLYKFKVRVPFYVRGSKVSVALDSEWTQRIFEKMSTMHNWEVQDVFEFNNIL